MDSTVCSYCYKKFYDSSSKNRHIKKIHSVEIEVKPKISHIICPKCPDDNKQSFASYILLMNHISDNHKIIIEQKNIKFASKEDFENWRALEKRTVNYAKHTTVHNINTMTTYYNCNRSNSHGHQSTCSKRTSKRGGSIKINGVCPSRIIAHHNNNSGEVEVNFVETHVGHDMDFRSQRLTIPEENEVVAKLKAGVSADRIIRDARKFNEGELNRYNLLNKQDLTNYRIKHNIANKKESNDMVAVDEDEAVEGKIWNTICNKYRPTSNNYKSRKISKAHRIAEGCNVNEFVEVEEFGKFKVKSSTGEKFYSVLYDNAGVCNCEGMKCNMCSICVHTYKCECVEYAVKNTICKHAHMVSMYERGMAVGSILDENNEDTKNVLCNEDESEEKLKSNEAITEFIEEKCATLNNDVNLNLQDDLDKDTRKKIIIESWRSTTLNYLDDFYNWDDASFEKLKTDYNSFLNKIAKHQSMKRKMEKQTYSLNKRQRRE